MKSRTVERFVTPVQEFLRTEAASGVVLGLATIVALVLANSPLATFYEWFLELRVVAGIGAVVIDKPLLLWINDGLMAIFFLVVGLEIKREMKYGQLADFRSALFPVVAACGGAIVPALIYLGFTGGSNLQRGWAIPMATDIAFALGLLALLGPRVPSWAKLFLLALAVVDDLIAVLIIALFYTESLKPGALGVAAAAVVLLIAFNVLGVKRISWYVGIGLILWVAVLKSGVHATIAGVVLGFTIPAIARRQRSLTDEEVDLITTISRRNGGGSREDQEMEQQRLEEAEDLIVDTESPLHRLEHKLHPLVAWAIIPVFAFANAGVSIDPSAMGSALRSPMTLGIIVGLFVGKQVGIFSAAFALIRLGLTTLEGDRDTLAWIYGISMLAGIGFTMSLFIGGLAFGAGPQYEQAKIGILFGSLVSGVTGFLFLRSRVAQMKDQR